MAYKMGKAGHSQEKASKSMGKSGGWPLKSQGKCKDAPKLQVFKK